MPSKKRVLLIIESSTSYGRGIVRGIAAYVQEHNEWWIDIENRGIMEPPPPILKDWDGDGVICRLYNHPTITNQLAQLKCPVVDLLSQNPVLTAMVRADDQIIAEMALEHFLENQLKHFGYYAFGRCYWAEDRGKQFRETLKKKGLVCEVCPVPSRETPSVDPVWKKSYDTILCRWLEKLPRPIGILAANDSHAIRLASACRKLDIAVPEEIAILGVNDDQHLCQALTPTLSSIDLGSERIGYEAARILDCRMRGKLLPKQAIFVPPVRVIARQSTDMCAIENEEVVSALRFIREFATQGIGVRDVLEALNISSRTLERGFKEHLGYTPEKEIARVRMKHALNLLRESRLSHEEIARLSGYGSLRYFLEVFKAAHGETPTQFRRRESLNAYMREKKIQ